METTEYIISFIQNGEFECTQQFENEADAITAYAEYGDDTDKQNISISELIVYNTGSI